MRNRASFFDPISPNNQNSSSYIFSFNSVLNEIRRRAYQGGRKEIATRRLEPKGS